MDTMPVPAGGAPWIRSSSLGSGPIQLLVYEPPPIGSCREVQDAGVVDEVRAVLVRETFEAQHARLWRAVAVWSGSSDVADETVAETFAQLVRRGPDVADPAAWVWRTAFRIAAGELQRRRCEAGQELGEVSLPPGQSELVLDLMRALQHLSAQQRACVVLCDLLGYSAEEAGPLLHTSAAAVRVQRLRARRRLRVLLEVTDV
jgi:DNA-directed RNA polymerase specialized sigma24 family protein